ncbi:MAG TPA: TIGR03067 domain-containing protein [Gemmataceae bacterium]|nr:TIGR03067 domain-containing protein [Gemmataceae bacterium]
MRHLAIFAMLGMLGIGNAQPGSDDAKKLQGAWLLTDLVVGGIAVPKKTFQGTTFVFAGDKLTIVPPRTDRAINASFVAFTLAVRFPVLPVFDNIVNSREFTVKLDPDKMPAAADVKLTLKDGLSIVSPAIYEIQGDTLRWCQSDDEDNVERPKTFASPQKSRLYLFTFKRVKQ